MTQGDVDSMSPDKENHFRSYILHKGCLLYTSQFETYNEYGGKVLKKELLFQVQGSAPNRIKQISAVYDSEWQFSIIL